MNNFLHGGLGFDSLYRRIFVYPVLLFARYNKPDVVDALYRFIVWMNFTINAWVVTSQNGRVRWYLLATVAGTVLMLGGLIWWR